MAQQGTRDGPQFHASALPTGLRDTHLGGPTGLSGNVWRLVYLSGGAIRLEPSGSAWLEAPAILWTPWSDGMRLRIRAGGEGTVLTMSEQMLGNTLGHKPEATDMRVMLQNPASARFATRSDTHTDIAQSITVILREAAGGAPGAATLVEAQCRTIAVHLWRAATGAGTDRVPARAYQRELQAFRTLLEHRFRQRWTVRAYAQTMGISTDRLHHLCRRALGRSPRELIRERLAYEAGLMLTRSDLPLGVISGQLGFVDAAQFSKFFRQQFGFPPGAYRRRFRDATRAGEPGFECGFADWP